MLDDDCFLATTSACVRIHPHSQPIITVCFAAADAQTEGETYMEKAHANVAANPEMSDRAIAEKIGVNHKTVAKAGARTGDQSSVAKRTGKDGKKRKQPKARKRKQPKSQARKVALPPPGKMAYSLDETAALLGVCVNTVRRAVETKKLKVKHWGARVLIPRENVTAFVLGLPEGFQTRKEG